MTKLHASKEVRKILRAWKGSYPRHHWKPECGTDEGEPYVLPHSCVNGLQGHYPASNLHHGNKLHCSKGHPLRGTRGNLILDVPSLKKKGRGFSRSPEQNALASDPETRTAPTLGLFQNARKAARCASTISAGHSTLLEKKKANLVGRLCQTSAQGVTF
jgi:hypothetical protein